MPYMPFMMYNLEYLIYILPGLILAMYAQSKISSNYAKYSRVNSGTGKTGREVAREILDRNGLYTVQIERISGNLTDHYDPRSKVLRLSQGVYDSTSVAALGIAAHEVGHAVQDAENYGFLKLRNVLVPAANFGSQFAFILVALGIFFQNFLVELGVALFAIAVLFQLITLPVEYDASNRAKEELQTIIYSEEGTVGVRKVLSAAALTYVASLLTALGTLLRLLSIAGNSRGRD
ncbi:zinc metallopeptidase [Peptoniphilus sp. KCTC 25270]|uniref:zinc metallopeptidase n=1 Tax=Peptoniphilus sp. KCTC 25270 TaxID=2897414 RepID=UPI00351D4B81